MVQVMAKSQSLKTTVLFRRQPRVHVKSALIAPSGPKLMSRTSTIVNLTTVPGKGIKETGYSVFNCLALEGEAEFSLMYHGLKKDRWLYPTSKHT